MTFTPYPCLLRLPWDYCANAGNRQDAGDGGLVHDHLVGGVHDDVQAGSGIVDAVDCEGVVAFFQSVACGLSQFFNGRLCIFEKCDQVVGRFLGGIGFQRFLRLPAATAQ